MFKHALSRVSSRSSSDGDEAGRADDAPGEASRRTPPEKTTGFQATGGRGGGPCGGPAGAWPARVTTAPHTTSAAMEARPRVIGSPGEALSTSLVRRMLAQVGGPPLRIAGAR